MTDPKTPEPESSDNEVKDKPREESSTFKSAKGQRMAKAVAEYILLRYFFPSIKDRKKQRAISAQFILDMQFNLCNGKAT
jgi:hypothetical protein